MSLMLGSDGSQGQAGADRVHVVFSAPWTDSRAGGPTLLGGDPGDRGRRGGGL